MHVFTYGTLMFPEIWRAIVGRDFATVAGTAAGFANYRLVGAVFPGLVAAADSDAVHGVVYLDVDDNSLERLDLFEGDFYERQALWIACDDGQQLQAAAYIVPPRNRSGLTNEPWDRDEFVAAGGLAQFIRQFAGFARLESADHGSPGESTSEIRR
jgi:gamma-glutamylcyclotransferase (GGCT)/AIG2-like uncharacterized protein YtfP